MSAAPNHAAHLDLLAKAWARWPGLSLGEVVTAAAHYAGTPDAWDAPADLTVGLQRLLDSDWSGQGQPPLWRPLSSLTLVEWQRGPDGAWQLLGTADGEGTFPVGLAHPTGWWAACRDVFQQGSETGVHARECVTEALLVAGATRGPSPVPGVSATTYWHSHTTLVDRIVGGVGWGGRRRLHLTDGRTIEPVDVVYDRNAARERVPKLLLWSGGWAWWKDVEPILDWIQFLPKPKPEPDPNDLPF